MGQATLDLPDPTQGLATPGAPPSADTPANVDDLLAQMAGEEIDRLLSEADDTPPTPEPTPGPPAAAAAAAPAPAPILETAPPAKVEAPAPVEALPTATPTPAAVPAEPPSAAEEVAKALAEDELAALSQAANGDLLGQSADIAQPAAEADTDADDAPLPAYLKPLAWLSLPLDAGPDWMRELVGKVALMTLFNATAVLVYVFLFRRHH